MILLAVFNRHINGMYQRFYIIAINVKYRRKRHLGQISTIGRRTGIFKIGSKTNLIINYQVNGTAGFITIQFSHLQNLIHNTLAGYRGIAMY